MKKYIFFLAFGSLFACKKAVENQPKKPTLNLTAGKASFQAYAQTFYWYATPAGYSTPATAFDILKAYRFSFYRTDPGISGIYGVKFCIPDDISLAAGQSIALHLGGLNQPLLNSQAVITFNQQEFFNQPDSSDISLDILTNQNGYISGIFALSLYRTNNQQYAVANYGTFDSLVIQKK